MLTSPHLNMRCLRRLNSFLGCHSFGAFHSSTTPEIRTGKFGFSYRLRNSSAVNLLQCTLSMVPVTGPSATASGLPTQPCFPHSSKSKSVNANKSKCGTQSYGESRFWQLSITLASSTNLQLNATQAAHLIVLFPVNQRVKETI